MYCAHSSACWSAPCSAARTLAAVQPQMSCMRQQRYEWPIALGSSRQFYARGQRSAPRRARYMQSKVTTNKMHVPSDSFGGQSPEKKASTALQTLFTFIAVKIVLAQLEGSGRGALASMNPRSYEDLVGLIQEHPMTDGDAWLKMLLVKNEMLAVRIMEVRATYSQEDFEWDQLQRLAQSGIQKANVALMQQHAQESFTKRMLAESAEGSEGSS